MNTLTSIYQDIAKRTAGDIYIGVVGPARTGKSTFIKRFMETMVLPNITDEYRRERARNELPPERLRPDGDDRRAQVCPRGGGGDRHGGGRGLFRPAHRLRGLSGPRGGGPAGGRPAPDGLHAWFPEEIPMAEAAEIGTRKVIAEHSTIGIVVTTDGTVTDLPREAYLEAEARVISELKELGKPFLILLNSARPDSDGAQALRAQLAEEYDVTCLAVSCLDLSQRAVTEIIQSVLFEFPVEELQLFLPDWVDALAPDHPIKGTVFEAIRGAMGDLHRIRDVRPVVEKMAQCELVTGADVTAMRLGSGSCEARLELPRSLFYETMSQQTGFPIRNDGELLSLLRELAGVQAAYKKVAAAMEEVRATGYGIVIPDAGELELEEPEIIKQGGRYGVRLRAKAPSIHMIRADIQAEVSPIVGSEKQSEDMLGFLLQEFEGEPERIWQSNIFGRSFHELINEDLASKLKHMPEDAREKMRQTLEKIINEGSGGLICIIL